MTKFLSKFSDLGLLIIRLVIGFSFAVIYGWGKITGGVELWGKLGKSMSNIGITFLPEFWGFMAAISEFGGGILLMLGLFTRTTSSFLAFTMLIAMISHLVKLDPWSRVFNPLEMMAVFVAFVFLGGGRFSLDRLIFRNKN